MFQSTGIGEPGMAPGELRKARRWIFSARSRRCLGRGAEPCLVQILYHFVARPARNAVSIGSRRTRLRLVAGFSMSKEGDVDADELRIGDRQIGMWPKA